MSEPAVVDVAHWPVISQEFRGDEPKDWAAPPEKVGADKSEWWLFKPAKIGRESGYRRYEDVAEFVASQLASLILLPAAEARLALGKDDEGSISRNVAPADWELVSGDVLLSEFSDYESCAGDNRPKNRRGHSLGNIARALDGFGGPPQSACEGWSAFEVFAGYLVFDAWIANTDRHALNWGVLSRGPERRLAASFDHGSALASGVTNLNLPSDIAKFCGRGYAHRFEGGRRKLLTDLAHEAVTMAGGRAELWLERVAGLDPSAWDQILAAAPRVSVPRRTFLTAMLAENQRRLR